VVERVQLLVRIAAAEHEVPGRLAVKLGFQFDERLTEPPRRGATVLLDVAGLQEPGVGERQVPGTHQCPECFDGFVAHRHLPREIRGEDVAGSTLSVMAAVGGSVVHSAVHTHDRETAAAAANRVAPHRPRISFPDPDAIEFDLRSASFQDVSSHSVTVHGMRYTAFADPIDFLLAGMMIDGNAEIRVPGQECSVGSGDGFLYPLATEYRCEFDDIELLHLGLPLARVQQRAEEAVGIAAADLRFHAIMPVSEPMRRLWSNTTAFLHRQLHHELDPTPLVAHQLITLAASAVLAVFPNTTMTIGDVVPDGGHSSPAVVRRAVAFAEAHAERPLGVGDLAASAGVGVRALQQAFRRHLDTTPTAYLRRIRLERAHRELRAADPTTGVTVAEVAHRWGFAGHDRFARAYREAYGRSPGDTLRS
jgi:AraC-like DNA-binding protein